MSEEFRIYKDGSRRVIQPVVDTVNLADFPYPKESEVLDLVIAATEQMGSVDGWVFICHPSSWMAKRKEMFGHEVIVDSIITKGSFVFSKDFKPVQEGDKRVWYAYNVFVVKKKNQD